MRAPSKAELKQAASVFGRAGGKMKSPAKTLAARENAKQPRPNARKPRNPRTGRPAHRRPKPVPNPAKGKRKPGDSVDKYPGMTRPF